MRQLRKRADRAVSVDTSFAFLPADIVSQILNFGLPAPLDVQVAGFNVDRQPRLRRYACSHRLHQIPGIVDLRIQQAFNYPTLQRRRGSQQAALLGLTETDVASDLLVSLSGSSQTMLVLLDRSEDRHPVPGRRTDARSSASASTHRPAPLPPVTGAGSRTAQLLANLATFRRSMTPAVVSHYDATRSSTSTALPTARISVHISARSTSSSPTAQALPAARLAGQGARTDQDDGRLPSPDCCIGLAGAIILVYLLIVVNFQSWLDPFIIVTALPAALGGIVWMLFRDGHPGQRAGAHRRHHVHGRRHGEQRAGRELRARSHDRGRRCPARSTRRPARRASVRCS